MLLSNLPFRTLLLRSSRLFTDKMNDTLQKFDLNHSQWIVLHVIHDAQKCSLIEIAKELNISQPAVTKRISELEQKQLITFIQTQDRREKIVTLNELGLQFYLQGQVVLDQLEQKFCQDISETDFVKVQAVLKLFLKNLEHEDDQHEI